MGGATHESYSLGLSQLYWAYLAQRRTFESETLRLIVIERTTAFSKMSELAKRIGHVKRIGLAKRIGHVKRIGLAKRIASL